ncbi:uncharacterized protein LOC135317504 [Phalacrocorax carbo]|uniref:uncharacterized protein LOC135317504 n=1 Tax=Phalacrocorax carbo TaxID=9209 RepID=UPI0031198B44
MRQHGSPRLALGVRISLLGTLNAMDYMLEKLVLSFLASRVSEELQSILQVLLKFTNSDRAAVQERALGRITTLSRLLADNSTLKGWSHFEKEILGPVCYREIQIPILGQLLGRLLLFEYARKQISFQAVAALDYLAEFICGQKSRSVLKDKAQQLHQEPEITFVLRLHAASNSPKDFAAFLRPSERTDIVLVAIEAMRDSSFFDKEAAGKMLDLVMRNSDFWLADVPKVMKGIHENLEGTNRSLARQSIESLLLLLTDRYPGQAVISLVTLSPPGHRTGMAMWEVVFSSPQTSEKILKEFLSLLQYQWLHMPLSSSTEPTCTSPLLLTASSDFQSEDFGDQSHVETHQRPPSLVTVSLLVGHLIVLSERPDVVSRAFVKGSHAGSRGLGRWLYCSIKGLKDHFWKDSSSTGVPYSPAPPKRRKGTPTKKPVKRPVLLRFLQLVMLVPLLYRSPELEFLSLKCAI